MPCSLVNGQSLTFQRNILLTSRGWCDYQVSQIKRPQLISNAHYAHEEVLDNMVVINFIHSLITSFLQSLRKK
jgi:hypothetical protein